MSGVDHAPELHPGSTGEWVTYLQRLLTAADLHQNRWPVTVNGHFDHTTAQAVRAFQAWVPIHASGVVDTQTWARLYDVANRAEQVDETMGQIIGDSHAGQHGHKLAAGEEVGRRGWHRVNVQATVLDFKGEVLRGAHAYVRFTSAENQESDEYGTIDDGTLTLPQVWMPAPCTLTVYVNVAQGGITSLTGNIHIQQLHGDYLALAIHQDTDTHTVTHEEAEQNGWVHGSEVKVGTDFEVLSTEGTFSEQHNNSSSHGYNEQLQIRIPRPTVTITTS